MKESTNYRTINIKLRRVDVCRINRILIGKNMGWTTELYERIKEQLEKFDKKLEEEEHEHKTV